MKKLVSKFMAVLMAMTMILSMSMTAFAAEVPKGTLTVNNTVEGKTLDLYQIFTATKSGDNVAYTLNSAYEGFFQSKIEGASTLTGEALSEKAYAYVKEQVGTNGGADTAKTFAKDMLGWILDSNNNITATKEVTTTATSTVVSDLAYGYYLVYPKGATDTSTAPGNGNQTYTSAASLVNITADTATINMKSNYPTVDKKIIPAQSGSGIKVDAIVDGSWEGSHQMELDDENESEDAIAPHGAADEKKAGDFGIGDTVTYQLTSKVPDMTGYTSYTFKFTDTLSKGLDLKAILSVKVESTELKASKTGANTYSLSYDKTNRILTVTLNDFYNSYKNHVGDTITVVYTATLNKDAVIGMNPNTNKAEIEYSNDPNGTGTGKSNPSEADVYTFNFKIFKQDEKKSPLSGAKFELYHSKTENNEEVIDETRKISLVKETTTDNSNLYRESPTSGAGTTTIIESAADGYAQIKGLEEGTYFLHETEAPTGYNKLIGDIKLIIQADFDETTGVLNSFSVKYTYGTEEEQTVTVKNKDDFAIIPITNKTGTELPSTGSKGAFIVTLAGILLFGGLAVSSAYSKKKKVIK